MSTEQSPNSPINPEKREDINNPELKLENDIDIEKIAQEKEARISDLVKKATHNPSDEFVGSLDGSMGKISEITKDIDEEIEGTEISFKEKLKAILSKVAVGLGFVAALHGQAEAKNEGNVDRDLFAKNNIENTNINTLINNPNEAKGFFEGGVGPKPEDESGLIVGERENKEFIDLPTTINATDSEKEKSTKELDSDKAKKGFPAIFGRKDTQNNENKKSGKIVHFDEFLKQSIIGGSEVIPGHPLYKYFMGEKPINDERVDYGQILYFKPPKEIENQYKRETDQGGNEYWDKIATSSSKEAEIEASNRDYDDDPITEADRKKIRAWGEFVTTMHKPDKSVRHLYTYHPHRSNINGQTPKNWQPKENITNGDMALLKKQKEIVEDRYDKYQFTAAERKQKEKDDEEQRITRDKENQLFNFGNNDFNPFFKDFSEKNGYYMTSHGNDEEKYVWQKDGVDVPMDIVMREFERAYAENPSEETLAKTEEDKIAMDKLRGQNIEKIDKFNWTDEELTKAIEDIDRTAKTEIDEKAIDEKAMKIFRSGTDTDNSFATRKWMYDWLKHPESIKRAKNLGLTEEELTHTLNALAIPFHYSVDKSIAFDEEGNSTDVVGGMNPLTMKITVVDDNDLPTIAHETGHRSGLGRNEKLIDVLQRNLSNDPQFLEYLKMLNDKNRETGMLGYREGDEYKYDPDEIYSRIWHMRKKYNLQPGQKVLPSMIKDYNPNEFFGMDRKEMIYLLNLLVKNEKQEKGIPKPGESDVVDTLA